MSLHINFCTSTLICALISALRYRFVQFSSICALLHHPVQLARICALRHQFVQSAPSWALLPWFVHSCTDLFSVLPICALLHHSVQFCTNRCTFSSISLYLHFWLWKNLHSSFVPTCIFNVFSSGILLFFLKLDHYWSQLHLLAIYFPTWYHCPDFWSSKPILLV